MEYIRNVDGNITGYKTCNYCLIKHEGKWYSHTKDWITGNPHFDIRIAKGWVPNKYLLHLVGALINLILLLAGTTIIICAPLIMYYVGAKNFFKNGVWVDNVRFFGWANFILMITFLILFLTT